MREVSVDRFVDAKPFEVAALLTPETVVECEGSFDVREVTTTSEGTVVTAGRSGVELRLQFEDREDGLAYEQLEGPLERLSTTVTYAPENHGTRLTTRSEVAAGGPGVVERLAAWKRRGELKRALAGIAERC